MRVFYVFCNSDDTKCGVLFLFFCAMMLANVAQLYRTTSGFVETSRFSTITVCKDI